MRVWIGILLWVAMTTLCLGEPSEQVVSRTTLEGYGKESVESGDSVSISYTLSLAGGDIVDVTPRDKPFRFSVDSKEVVPGISRGVLGMKEGETRELEIPPSLGYGSVAVGPIPANSTLYFKVKLVGLERAKAADSDLSEVLGRDGFGSRPSAQELEKPAVFEYLIRDFFSRPWRYHDAAGLVWKANGILTAVALVLLGFVMILPRKRDEEDEQ